ncbi:MAG: PAN domain-containing protein [Bacteroidota bacterium]
MRVPLLLAAFLFTATGCAEAERLVRDTMDSGTPGTTGTSGPQAPPAPETGEPAWEVRGGSFTSVSGPLTLSCPPNPSRATVYSVYGQNPHYWGSSPLCQAGVHAGAITYASGGNVVFEMRPGRSSYAAGARNVEDSGSASAWDFSFAILNGSGGAGVSGGGAAVEAGIDRPGADYRSFDAGGAGYAVCQAACASATECRAWTHTAPGIQSEGGMCWLKNAVPEPVQREGTTSGVK